MATPATSGGSANTDSGTTAAVVPRIVSLFEHLPSPILQDFVRRKRVNLISPPPGLTFSELHEWFLTHLPGADAAITWPVAGRFGAEQIAAAGDRLKVVSTYSVGTDAVDRVACHDAGIRVGYTPYIGDDSIAEYTIAMLLHYCRRIDHLLSLVMEGKFAASLRDVLRDPTMHCGFSPAGKTVGFYGFGRIAQKTAEKLLSFGVKKIAYTTSRSKPFAAESFPRLYSLRESFYPQTQIVNEPNLLDLAAQSDILIVLCPGNASTSATINSTVFDRMKSTAVLINVARGTVVVNEDLEKALRENKIAAALLDVIQGEPNVDASHPLLAEDLRDRVMILPHTASTVVDTRKMMADVTARNILTSLGFADDLLGDKASLIEQHAWTHFAE
ncbi:putative Glyoxylate reductase 1 (putative) [Pseudozyma hubeiensis]|nr:putative Glyoxylate reductase 1 (putative) [Pseudozyma hubeiensis]